MIHENVACNLTLFSIHLFPACLFLFLAPDFATLRLLLTALNLARAAFLRSGL